MAHAILSEDPSLLKGSRSQKYALESDAFCLRMPLQNVSAEGQACIAQLLEKGYVIIPNLLSPEKLQRIRDVLKPHLHDLAPKGRNNFEGALTQRVYSLLNKTRELDDVLCHPRVLEILDSLMLPNYLVTAFLAINILPKEAAQALHHDDQFVEVPRPHRAFSIATIWAIDDFTAENGATVVIPNSHKWADTIPSPSNPQHSPVSVVMPAGSVVVFLSTLWHGGGANVSDSARLAVSAQYCEPWLRQQENQILAVNREHLPYLSEKVLSLMGYSIHPPFIGHVNGQHPLKTLSRL
eukprot:c16211_g1_i1.p1 GENE.c16211_g1_i1~~c16211_g1_i1.p1  ORF type:complete len:295 (+),score=66.93 c16211_g1_i1:53-937(+)